MRRILMMVLKMLYKVPYWFYKICQMAKDTGEEKFSLEEKYRLIRHIVIEANQAGNVQIVSSGQENIPEKDGFILYPNHQGMYDMLAVIETLERPYAVVFKIEVENIILLKQIKEALHYLPMDRSDLKQSMKVILEVAKRVKQGENFLIFAEGTRSKKGNEIQTFKAGAFKAATKSKAPIVPVALLDSFEPFDSHSVKPVTVQVHYLKPMYYEEYAEMNTTEIALEVEKRIREAIAQHV
jgi:1-acyl-sn-glycerol-3-phosphate acyltransferase